MSKIKANLIENVAGTATHNVDTMGIESGSNANGSYTKFPDGTLITKGVLLSDQTSVIHIYPFPFVGQVIVSLSCVGTTAFYTTTANGNETQVEVFKWNMDGTANTQNRYMNITAIGRWK